MIHYEFKLGKYVTFQKGSLARLWDKGLKISLENTVMTSLITETVMYDDSPENLAKFKDIYGLLDNSDFKTLFDIFRFMTQEFLLGGDRQTMNVTNYLFGYNSTRVQHLYDERGYYDGKEVAIDGFIN